MALGGETVLAQENEFVGMAGGVLDYYVDLMGDVPKLLSRDAAATPVVIINEADVTDGQAIGNNISILLEPAGNAISQHIARLTFAHEFFHLWNGKSFMPSGEDGDWFKEGFTNYSVTGNEESVDDLTRFLFDEFGDNTYDLADIERALGGLNNGSQRDFFDRYIHGVESIPLAQFVALAGIDTVDEGGQTIFKIRENSDADSSEIRRGLFGD